MQPVSSRALVVVAGLLAILLLAVPPAASHPPSDLVLAYDETAGELSATFTHRVEDTATHYVKSVRIEGPATFVEHNYTSQPTAGTFTYTYPLRLDPRTTITVRGDCSLGGEVVQTLAIGAMTNESPAATAVTITPTTAETTIPSGTTAVPATTQAPGFAVAAACLALAAVAGRLGLAKR